MWASLCVDAVTGKQVAGGRGDQVEKIR